ncbi:MAG: hypothetical protein AB8B69_19860, partial [Chitinophagales bacterium]
MKTTTLSTFLLILSGFLLFSCNSSIDKSAAKGDAMKVVESLSDEPQAESATTLTANEASNDLELETEKEVPQAEGEIVELVENTDSSEEMMPTETIEKEDSNAPNPSESGLSNPYTEEKESVKSDEDTGINEEEETKKAENSSTDAAKNTANSNEPKPKEETVNAPLKSLGDVTDGFLKKYVSGGLVSYKS